MQRHRGLLFLAAALGVVSGAPSQGERPVRIRYAPAADASGRDAGLFLDAFRPEGWSAGDRRAAVVFFEGTARPSAPDGFARLSRALCGHGLVAFCAEVRGRSSAPSGRPTWAAVHDAQRAVRFVRARADELGVDPTRIAAGGAGLGGWIAGATALLDHPDETGEDASVPCTPQLLLLYGAALAAPDAGAAGHGGSGDVAVDPVVPSLFDHLRAGVLPPAVLFHGTADRQAPIGAVRRFRDRAVRLAARCVLHEVAGGGGRLLDLPEGVLVRTPAAGSGQAALDCLERTVVFLGEHRFLPPAPFQRTYLEPLAEQLRVAWPRNRTVHVVCHGHSVPAGYARTPRVDKAASYPFLLHLGLNERFPHAPVNVITTAVGGEHSERGAERFRDEVLNHRPDLITIDYCLNDRRIGLGRAERAWRSMIESALVERVPVLLMTPTADLRADLADPADPLNRHAEQVRALAAEYRVGLVDSLEACKEYLAAGGKLEDLMSQVNHPNRRGHALVAERMLRWFPR